MKKYRQIFAVTLVLLFADVAADPLQPSAQPSTSAPVPVTTGAQPVTLTQLSPYFFAAARSGETAVLQEFIQAGFPVDLQNDASYTALMIAAYQGQANAVNILLKAGADACIRDKRGHTALMGAMIKAEWGIAKQLYVIDCDKASSATATDVITDKSQMTAAQFAERFGQSDKFKALATQLQHGSETPESAGATAQP